MNTIKAGLILVAFWLASSLVMAGDNLSTAEMKQLLSGNSVEETTVRRGWVSKLYFKPDGNIISLDQNGNKNSFEWDFEREGVLCIRKPKQRCYVIKPAGEENTYNVHSRNSGEHKKVWKAKQGNAYKL